MFWYPSLRTRERHFSIRSLKNQLSLSAIDSLERQTWQQIQHDFLYDLQAGTLLAIVQINRPLLQRVEFGVIRK